MKKFSKVVFKTEFNNLPVCKYDSEQIQHVLVHLFTNSADAKPDARITIKTFVDDSNINVVVEDDGPGFPPEIQNHFVQILSPEKNSYGLYLCKSIIERHNGTIEVLKREKGAAIQFSLPIN